MPLTPLRARPAKVATPLDEGARGAARGDGAAGARVIVAVAVPELTVVTTLPPESSTLTTGWVPRAAPLSSVDPGSVVMTSWVAAPVDMVMFDEAAEVKPSPVKVRV